MPIEESRLGPQAFPRSIDEQYDEDGVGLRYLAVLREKAGGEFRHPSAQFIRRQLRPEDGMSLLDVGCGGGEDLEHYRDLGFGGARGLECSHVMAGAARRRLGDRAIMLGSWSRIPLPDSSLDYLVGRSSLHYEEDLDTAYREAGRVLRPGGMLVVIVAHPAKAANRRIVARGGREYVQDTLWGQVPITYPRHTLEEYLSTVFADLFDLVERADIETERTTGREPDQLGIAARRRGSSEQRNNSA
jgi:ubiquinone/menaquinone biosynthesis C-methylase UbiE